MDSLIEITDKAKVQIEKIFAEQNPEGKMGLRLKVIGGGCSGLQYGMALEAEPRPYDNVFAQDGVQVFIDPTSMMYLVGATIDYEDALMGGGFKIDNPNAVSGCGCGHSFKAEGHAGGSAGGSCSTCG